MYFGGFREGVSPLNHAKTFFKDLIIKIISSLINDLKKNRFKSGPILGFCEEVVPLNDVKTFLKNIY